MKKSQKDTRVVYVIANLMFCLMLVTFNAYASITVADYGTLPLIERDSQYIQKIQNNTKLPTLNPIISELNIQHENLNKLKNGDAVATIFSLIAMPILILIPVSTKNLGSVIPKFTFVKSTHFVILITLFFSIGLAFYASCSFIELSGTQTITQLYSTIDQNHEEKTHIMITYLNENLDLYHKTLRSAVYFFIIFIYVVIVGIRYEKARPFIQQMFILGMIALVAGWFWSSIVDPTRIMNT